MLNSSNTFVFLFICPDTYIWIKSEPLKFDKSDLDLHSCILLYVINNLRLLYMWNYSFKIYNNFLPFLVHISSTQINFRQVGRKCKWKQLYWFPKGFWHEFEYSLKTAVAVGTRDSINISYSSTIISICNKRYLMQAAVPRKILEFCRPFRNKKLWLP